MIKYPFTYTVVILDEVNHNETTFLRESGMGISHTFTHAMEQIETYYGKNLVAVKDLELLEEGGLILLPEKFIDMYKRTSIFEYPVPCDAEGNDVCEEIDDEDLPF